MSWNLKASLRITAQRKAETERKRNQTYILSSEMQKTAIYPIDVALGISVHCTHRFIKLHTFQAIAARSKPSCWNLLRCQVLRSWVQAQALRYPKAWHWRPLRQYFHRVQVPFP